MTRVKLRPGLDRSIVYKVLPCAFGAIFSENLQHVHLTAGPGCQLVPGIRLRNFPEFIVAFAMVKTLGTIAGTPSGWVVKSTLSVDTTITDVSMDLTNRYWIFRIED